MSDCKAVGTLVVLLWKSAYFWPLLSNDGAHLNTLEGKIRIHAQACNILYLYFPHNCFGISCDCSVTHTVFGTAFFSE